MTQMYFVAKSSQALGSCRPSRWSREIEVSGTESVMKSEFNADANWMQTVLFGPVCMKREIERFSVGLYLIKKFPSEFLSDFVAFGLLEAF